MEIERYTLATGETAVAGFARFWKPWGILFCVFAIVPNVWPGWGTAGATIFTYLVGGNPNVIAIILLLSIGVALTASPVVYQSLEKAEFFKVGLTIVFLIIAIFAAIKASAWADLPDAVSNFGKIPSDEVAIATILAGLVFAGAGGANNLVQSNWIRDKGFGMGKYVPHIVSPITGEDQAAPSTGTMVRQDEANIGRFNALVQAGFQGAARLVLGHLPGLDHRLLGPGLLDRVRQEPLRRSGLRLHQGRGRGPQGRRRAVVRDALLDLRLALARRSSRSAWSTTSRASSPTSIKTLYAPRERALEREPDLLPLVWSMVTFGILILLSGFDQPLVLLVLSACLNGMVMFVYSILLIRLNRKSLPTAIRVSGLRLGMLLLCVLFYGFFAGWLIIVQLGDL